MAHTPIALQLYSVREDCARDLPGTLAAIAKMGYNGVEFAGYYNYSATDLRKMLDDLGLKAAGTHTGLATLLGDQLKATVEFNQILGNKFLIVPGLPADRKGSKAIWLDNARIFNEIAEQLRPYGMQTGYHNHMEEFKPLEGETAWDLFMSHTDSDIAMQLDIGNAMHGGAAPLPLLEKYSGRANTVHLKEYSATNNKALVGEGEAPWSEIFRLCEAQGKTEWYVVEQESYAYSPMECADRCLKNLKAMDL